MKNLSTRIWWAVGAVAVVGTSAWFFLRTPLHERLYAEYAQMPTATFTHRGTLPAPPYLQVAAETFNRGDYETALKQLHLYLGDNPQDSEVQFYIALCYLGLEQHDQAQEAFRHVIHYDKTWANDAYWYMAMSYLRENERIECIRSLGGIREDSEYYPRVLELWKQIR